MIKKVLLTWLLAAMPIVLISGNDRKIYELTQQEKMQLLNEADDFIDDIPEGYQDRQADAVLHALQGSGLELQSVRGSRDVTIEYSQGVEIKDITPIDGVARGVTMRLYKPKKTEEYPIPLLIYMHGGGWTFGSLNSCANFCDKLVSIGNVSVLAIDYSLAPENPFPRGLSDCISAVEYAFVNAAELGTTCDLISLGGDSSGGNLALATALYWIANKKSDEIRSLILFYPVVTVINDNAGSWKKYSRGYGLDRRLMEAFIRAYDDNGKADDTISDLPNEALISPIKASKELLELLPPTLMIAAERDILFDQGKEFYEKVKETGNSINWVEFPGSVHLFITVPGQPTAFNKAVTMTDDFLTDF